MDRIVLILVVLVGAGAMIAYILSKLSSKKWVGFVPSIIGFSMIAYYLLRIQFETLEGYEELGYNFIIFMIAAVLIGNLSFIFYIIVRSINAKRINSKQ